MKPHSLRSSWLALALLAGCTVPTPAGDALETTRSAEALDSASAETAPPQWNEPSTLYARDGSVVTGASDREGPVAVAKPGTDGAPTHDIQRTGEGRMYILELYQNVIEERDTLSLEVRGLNDELDRTRTALTAADARIDALESKVKELEAQRGSLESENMDLAGRLTTAQIRRLQAEKILLEIRLEESRALDAQIEAELAAATSEEQ